MKLTAVNCAKEILCTILWHLIDKNPKIGLVYIVLVAEITTNNLVTSGSRISFECPFCIFHTWTGWLSLTTMVFGQGCSTLVCFRTRSFPGPTLLRLHSFFSGPLKFDFGAGYTVLFQPTTFCYCWVGVDTFESTHYVRELVMPSCPQKNCKLFFMPLGFIISSY